MAGLFDRVRAAASAFGASDRNPREERYWGAVSAASMAGQVVTCESGLQLWSVQAVLEALAAPISTLPLMVYERTGDDTRRVAREHPLFKLLHRAPNATQTAQEFRDEQQRHLGWWRNAYAIIRPADNGGPVGSLDQVHPSRVMNVWRGSDGWIWYQIARLPPEIGSDTYRQDEIWHTKRAPLTPDGLRGKPVWETGRETIGKAQAVETFGALFFANGSHGGGVIKHPGNFKTKDDRNDFLDAWRSAGSGPNRHRDRLLLFGTDYSSGDVQNDQAQFLETKKQSGYEVIGQWNMPPHRVGMLERATNNNIEQQSIEFVVYTLAAPICAVEQSAMRDLLVGEDQDRYFIEHNVAGLLRGDIKTRYGAYAVGRQWGWLSINDILRFENMDPIGAEGDVHLTPTNMAPAGAAPPNGGKLPKDDPQEGDNAA